MAISVKVEGVDKLVRDLDDLAIKRIPNYVARGITMLAERVQEAMETETRGHLTVRGTWLRKGTRFGINRKAATKNDLTATVSTRAPWLVSEEEDVRRVPVAGGMHLAIPLASVRPSRAADVPIPRALMPRNLKRTFVVRGRDGSSILMQRVGKGNISGMVPMYTLVRQARIPKRIHLVDEAGKTVNRLWGGVADEIMKRAIEERGA